MTTPLWVLLAFTVWTVLVLMSGVAMHRWHLLLSNQAEFADFAGGPVEGTDVWKAFQSTEHSPSRRR
jgi:hypothetical protein